jgi:hypothetical protein
MMKYNLLLILYQLKCLYRQIGTVKIFVQAEIHTNWLSEWMLFNVKWVIFQQYHGKTRGSAHWACIAHLTIGWYQSKFQREIIITLKNSSHLEWRVGLSDTILKGTHPGTIYARCSPHIDDSCQVWLHLAKLFQRRRFF